MRISVRVYHDLTRYDADLTNTASILDAWRFMWQQVPTYHKAYHKAPRPGCLVQIPTYRKLNQP